MKVLFLIISTIASVSFAQHSHITQEVSQNEHVCFEGRQAQVRLMVNQINGAVDIDTQNLLTLNFREDIAHDHGLPRKGFLSFEDFQFINTLSTDEVSCYGLRPTGDWANIIFCSEKIATRNVRKMVSFTIDMRKEYGAIQRTILNCD